MTLLQRSLIMLANAALCIPCILVECPNSTKKNSLTRRLQILVNRTETEYVSQMLTKVKRFAQHHCCHVWFVAHPRQVGYIDLDHAFFFHLVCLIVPLVTVAPVGRGSP